MSLNNPYSVEETLDKLRAVLTAKAQEWSGYNDGIALLEKAVAKAGEDAEYARQMEETLLRGSTVELREWLSAFGTYMEPPRNEFPFYPHKDAVNQIDTGLHLVKCAANGTIPH